ncbi:tetratricopeptide repeat protein [Pyxidicoccus fallax]|uniref:Tetratricopeptide repeat protein n=1 Tax=Pyxidicoccus fallax TaxID=394095 RepID=A0A848LHC9_9BACT|nr:tetratricopeptide repeat protein [Pyxidicoccus fallax]NMO15818.1 tetratricopeptide repeat protein [Pyxidicoccus fallax]NPC79397.1 tetratricopeptide repeat protein [Pyxidicoccus fallax]
MGRSGANRASASRVDVLIVTAIRDEYDAVLKVDSKAQPGSRWEELEPGVVVRSFQAADGGTLRVAVVRALELGGVSATVSASLMVKQYAPRCLAMCGVCAGYRGKVELGDVIIADTLWAHDAGKLIAGSDDSGQRQERVLREASVHHLNAEWRRKASTFTPPKDGGWLGERPRPYEAQRDWLLERLVLYENPVSHPERKLKCADYKEVLKRLWKLGWLEDGTLKLTETGRRHIERERLLHPEGVPEPRPFHVHVGAIASVNRVTQDRSLFPRLSEAVRTVLGAEMEGWAIGVVAYELQTPFLLVMKGVMDFGDEEKDDRFKAFAARASAECLLAFLCAHLPSANAATGQRTGEAGQAEDFSDILEAGSARPPSRPGPAALLSARYRYVPFYEPVRAELLRELRAWCDDEEPVSARVFHGAGGAGKTRLLIEWCERLRAEGWLAGFLMRSADAARFEALMLSEHPTLIVIDYAESRMQLEALLQLVARQRESRRGAAFRVVLLARTAGDWLLELQAGDALIQELLSEHPPLEVTARSTSIPEREEMFRQAVGRFAEVRGCATLRSSPPDLKDPRFERILYIHMAALATVEGLAFTAESLMGHVLDHEERFWLAQNVQSGAQFQAERRLLKERTRRAVAALTLLGGAISRSEAEALVSRACGIRDEALVLGLHDLYPGGWREGSLAYLGGLEPDLLGDAMVLRALLHEGIDAEAWLERVFQNAGVRGLRAGFELLGRLSLECPEETSRWMTRLLERDLNGRGVAALEAAKALGQRTAHASLGLCLADVLKREGSIEVAMRLEMAGTPELTVSLLEAGEWVTETLLRALPGAKHSQDAMRRAVMLDRLSRFQATLGRLDAAMAASREAVFIYRRQLRRQKDELKRLELEVFLARSLDILSARQRESGLRELALASSMEAVAIHQRLASKYPGPEELVVSANGLLHLGLMLSEVGRQTEALRTLQEAVVAYRSLSAMYPGKFQSELAASLDVLGMTQEAVGQHAEALQALQASVELARELARTHPDRFLPQLASVLLNLGSVQGQMRLLRDALLSTQEAVSILRQLAEMRPDAFLHSLASAWNNLGVRQSEFGLNQEALVSAQWAVDGFRKLAETQPEAVSEQLAGCLSNLGNRLERVGRLEEAVAAMEEAVRLFRMLAKVHPRAFLPTLAMSLLNLGSAWRKSESLPESLRDLKEAESLYRELADEYPDKFLSGRAKALHNLGMVQEAMGQLGEALKTHEKSVALWRELAQAQPRMFLSELAGSLNSLGVVQQALGQSTEALESMQEAVDTIWPLFVETPEAFSDDTNVFLQNLLGQLNRMGREMPVQLRARLESFVVGRGT